MRLYVFVGNNQPLSQRLFNQRNRTISPQGAGRAEHQSPPGKALNGLPQVGDCTLPKDNLLGIAGIAKLIQQHTSPTNAPISPVVVIVRAGEEWMRGGDPCGPYTGRFFRNAPVAEVVILSAAKDLGSRREILRCAQDDSSHLAGAFPKNLPV